VGVVQAAQVVDLDGQLFEPGARGDRLAEEVPAEHRRHRFRQPALAAARRAGDEQRPAGGQRDVDGDHRCFGKM
jgi:hypothetical protein